MFHCLFQVPQEQCSNVLLFDLGSPEQCSRVLLFDLGRNNVPLFVLFWFPRNNVPLFVLGSPGTVFQCSTTAMPTGRAPGPQAGVQYRTQPAVQVCNRPWYYESVLFSSHNITIFLCCHGRVTLVKKRLCIFTSRFYGQYRCSKGSSYKHINSPVYFKVQKKVKNTFLVLFPGSSAPLFLDKVATVSRKGLSQLVKRETKLRKDRCLPQNKMYVIYIIVHMSLQISVLRQSNINFDNCDMTFFQDLGRKKNYDFGY